MKIHQIISQSKETEAFIDGFLSTSIAIDNSTLIEQLNTLKSQNRQLRIALEEALNPKPDAPSIKLEKESISFLTKQFDYDYLNKFNSDSVFLLVSDLCNYCQKNDFEIPELWTFIISKNGKLN